MAGGRRRGAQLDLDWSP